MSLRAAKSASTSTDTLRAAATTSPGKPRSCTLCFSISAASASALSRSISESAKLASVAQACVMMAFRSASSASQALSDTMHSPLPFALLKPAALVIRRDPIEAERDVGAGTDEFGGIEHAGLQAREDLARRRRLRRSSQPAIDLALQAATGHCGDPLGDPLGRQAGAGQALGPQRP